MPLPLYDAHNHLHDEWLRPHWEKIAAQLPALGLRQTIVNGTSETDWPCVTKLSLQHPSWITPAFGLHPWYVGNRSPDWFAALTSALDATPAAVIGEIGLDRWIIDRARPDDPRLTGLRRAPLDEQLEVFIAQLALASERDLPANIHCLDAWGPLHDTLRATRLPVRGFLLHAYSGPPDLIPAFTKLGAYFSFNGSFLHERRTQKLSTFRHVPADRLLIETDAPAMPLPQSWRTHKLPPSPDGADVNHPGNIEAAYSALAAFLDEPLPAFTARIEENFLRLFGSRPAIQ